MKRRFTALILLAAAAPCAAQWLSLKTPGIPRTADGKPDLTAPAPRTADGHPELSGLWHPVKLTGDLRDKSKVQTWARDLMAEREKNFYKDGPHMQCLPQGPGYIVGGGNPRATSWNDDQEDYRTNEIAINWQAALVYALAIFVDPSPQ